MYTTATHHIESFLKGNYPYSWTHHTNSGTCNQFPDSVINFKDYSRITVPNINGIPKKFEYTSCYRGYMS